ncbi:cbb3-type cytochrome oxidase assembly protein CcoS [bacterium]|nr:cbb3-type cytochrome oxidase assembly protein CcoS [bacterium]
MSVLWVALPVALMMASGAVAAFLWVVRSGQLDDLETPPIRILLDDESKSSSTVRTEKSSST